MSILIQTAKDTTADVGLNYFISLYGFPPGYVGNQIPLHQVTLENSLIVDNHIHGWITWNEARIPVLQKPADLTNQGEELLRYTDGTVSYPCAVIGNDGIIISLDIFSHLGLFTSGYLEKIWNSLEDEKKEIIAVPFTDYYCDFLFSCIRLALENAGTPLVHKSFWPDGHSCAVCLTHDVDEVKKTYQWITYPLKQIKHGKPGNVFSQFRSFIRKLKGYEPYWTFDEIIRVENSRGLKSSFYFLKEKLSWINALGIAISLSGVGVLVIGNYGFAAFGLDTLEGNILAMLGGVAAGLYILGGRTLRKKVSTVTYAFVVYAVGTITLFALCLILAAPVSNLATSDYGIILLMALISGIFGHTLYNWSLGYIPASIMSVALLGEPIGSSLLAYVIPWINQQPSVYTIIGGGIILLGIYLTARTLTEPEILENV